MVKWIAVPKSHHEKINGYDYYCSIDFTYENKCKQSKKKSAKLELIFQKQENSFFNAT